MKKSSLFLLTVFLLFSCTSKQTYDKKTLQNAIQIYESGDKDSAKQLFLKLSKKGDYNADYELCYRYIVSEKEAYKYLKNALLHGNEDAMNYFLERFLYHNNGFSTITPKKCLSLYKKYLKKMNSNSEDQKKMLEFLTKCASVPELNLKKFSEEFNINLDEEKIKTTPYFFWQFAEEASIGTGHFKKADPLLTMQLILLGGDCAIAEYQIAVNDYYDYYKNNEIHEFKIDNCITSGYGINFCSIRKQERNDKSFAEKIEKLKTKISLQNQKMFTDTVDSFNEFLNEKLLSEEGHSGTGYITWQLESGNKQRDDFLEVLEKIINNSKEPLTSKNINDLKSEFTNLLTKRDKILSNKTIHDPYFTVDSESEKQIDSLWDIYQTNFLSFCKTELGEENEKQIEKWIYEQRILDIKNLIEFSYDYD